MHAMQMAGLSVRLFGCSARWSVALLIALLLGACAGQHVKPSAGYADAPAKTVRVAYDQDGDTYPRDTSVVDWTSFRPSRYQSRFGGPLRLRDIKSPSGDTPYPAIRDQAQRAAEQALGAALVGSNTLVVLIHGFNNDYQEARASYDAMRQHITLDPDTTTYLEVFWDGLQLRSDKLRDKPGYASFWPDALTYSNLAGQFGLRPLLESIDQDVDLRFVTHSRGAAVALSALADPLYDAHIVFPQAISDGKPGLSNPHIRSVAIAAFAPAIGSGHLHDGLDQALATHPTLLLVGANPADFATSKSVLSSRFWGDTSLGSDPGYLLRQQSTARANLTLLAGMFDHGSEHALEAYFRNTRLTDCMFHHAGLRTGDSHCTLIGGVAGAQIGLPAPPDGQR